MTKKHPRRSRSGLGNRPRQASSRIGQEIEFTIDHLDGLGQGVMKTARQVTFIAKTLPGESGIARIVAEKKGVSFAVVERLLQSSGKRREPDCEHYAQCPGCHYQHIDYGDELAAKTAALWRLMQAYFSQREELQVIAAPQRYAYRNRVQLHYRHQYLGLIDSTTDQVLEIPHCKLICPQLEAPLAELYRDKSWRKTYSGSGHCELYTTAAGEVSVQWNQAYAHGGFTQVNQVMNQRLQALVSEYAQREKFSSVLDLFAGEGNLSDALLNGCSECSRVLVDYAPETDSDNKPADFMHLDLYADDALQRFERHAGGKQFDLMLVDPPRRGFAPLGAWIKALRPRRVIYISCNAATMRRDLQSMQSDFKLEFSVDALSLLDLFPATHHFESAAHISLKKIDGKKI